MTSTLTWNVEVGKSQVIRHSLSYVPVEAGVFGFVSVCYLNRKVFVFTRLCFEMNV